MNNNVNERLLLTFPSVSNAASQKSLTLRLNCDFRAKIMVLIHEFISLSAEF